MITLMFYYFVYIFCEEILGEANYFQQIIANITADVERDLNDVRLLVCKLNLYFKHFLQPDS